MKVLVVHTQYKLKGGEDSVVANELKLLRSNGVTTALLNFNNDGNTFLKLLQLPFNYAAYRKTTKKIKLFRPDVVHVHNLHFSGSAAVVCAIKKFKIPIVMTLHNYRMLCPSGSLYHQNQIFTSSIKGGFPWAAVKKGVYQNSSLITFWVAVSMCLHELLKTWAAVDKFILLGTHSMEIFSGSRIRTYAKNMVVKPNFCDLGPLSGKTLNTASFHYLYVGRLTEEKGLPVLLKAFANNNLPLKIVGTGPLENLVRDYEKKYCNISYLGEQQKENINQLLDQSQALIFPSVWYETFGMVVIEAFSKRVPVITSDLGNMKNMVTHQFNGLRFEAGNSLALSNIVSYYHGLSTEEKEKYRENAFKTYSDSFTPDKNLRQLLKIYHSAINRHSYRP